MIFTSETPRRKRLIGGTKEHDGIEYTVVQPFTAEQFAHLKEAVGVDAEGMARSCNQLIAENTANNIGAKIKAIRSFNLELEAAQAEGKRMEEEPKPFPTQEDLDAYLTEYDFSGVRESTGESSAMSVYEREIWKLAKRTIREVLKNAGVKVKSKGEAAGEKEVTWEKFVDMAGAIVERTGPWGDPSVTSIDPTTGEAVPLYYNKAEELHQLARAAEASAKDISLDSATIFGAVA